MVDNLFFDSTFYERMNFIDLFIKILLNLMRFKLHELLNVCRKICGSSLTICCDLITNLIIRPSRYFYFRAIMHSRRTI